jgi:hypothetical protein
MGSGGLDWPSQKQRFQGNIITSAANDIRALPVILLLEFISCVIDDGQIYLCDMDPKTRHGK